MDGQKEVTEEGLDIIPNSVQRELEITIGDTLEWTLADDSAIVERIKSQESDDAVTRRIALRDISMVLASGLTGTLLSSISDAIEVDEVLDSYLPDAVDDSPIHSRLLWFSGNMFVTPGRGAPEIGSLGEIDFLTQAELASAVLKSIDGVEPQLVDEVRTDKVGHIGTTTGPLGSEFVALSMGYNPNSIGEYQGRLPYIFDLAPSDDYLGMSLDELRNQRTNWSITRTYGDFDPLIPETKRKDGETTPTLGDSDRPKYDRDFGMVVVKRLHEGWERYDEFDDYSQLTAYEDNIHLLVAGCHGEGTLAAARTLSDEDLMSAIEERIPSDSKKYQATVAADIKEYKKRQDRQGDTVYVPVFQSVTLPHVESLQ